MGNLDFRNKVSKEIYLKDGVLGGLVSDVFVGDKSHMNTLKTAIAAGIPLKMLDVERMSPSQQNLELTKLVNYLVNDYGVREDTAQKAVYTLAFGLGIEAEFDNPVPPPPFISVQPASTNVPPKFTNEPLREAKERARDAIRGAKDNIAKIKAQIRDKQDKARGVKNSISMYESFVAKAQSELTSSKQEKTMFYSQTMNIDRASAVYDTRIRIAEQNVMNAQSKVDATWGQVGIYEREISGLEAQIEKLERAIEDKEDEIRTLDAEMLVPPGKRMEEYYNRLIGQVNAARYEQDFVKLAGEFREFGNYLDAPRLARECEAQQKRLADERAKAAAAETARIKEAGYQAALEKMKNADIDELNNLADQFRQMNYKDSAALEKECLAEMERKKKDRHIKAQPLIKERREIAAKYRNCISISDVHIAAVRPNGTVIAVGNNEKGQCQTGDWRDIVAVKAYYRCTYGLRADGTIVSTGMWGEYQDWCDIIDIGVSDGSLIGLKTDGKVVAVGLDHIVNRIELPNITALADVEFAGCYFLTENGAVFEDQSGKDYWGWRDIAVLSRSCDYIVGLRADGTVVASSTYIKSNVLEGLEQEIEIVDIAAGYKFVACLKADGTVVTHGESSDVLQKLSYIKSWRDIVAIFAAPGQKMYQVLGIRADGSVLSAGAGERNNVLDISSLHGIGFYNKEPSERPKWISFEQMQKRKRKREEKWEREAERKREEQRERDRAFQASCWIARGLCPKDGGTYSGLFTKKCNICGEKKG